MNLTNSDPSAATIPASVTIPAGVTSATFSLSGINNTTADGTRTLTISASAAGLSSATAPLTIADDETAALTLTFSPSSISENGGTATGTVTRNTTTSSSLVVNLTNSDPSAATVPATVTIPIGAAFTIFTVSAVNDVLGGDNRLTTITSMADGHAQAEFKLEILNEEQPSNWQNPHNWLDVNDDGFISPTDALLVINDLNMFGARSLLDVPPQALSPRQFIDVSGDYQSTPTDVLLVINYLNTKAVEDRERRGEGEADDEYAAFAQAFSEARWLNELSAPDRKMLETDEGELLNALAAEALNVWREAIRSRAFRQTTFL